MTDSPHQARTFVETTFEREDVLLDGNTFQRCRFGPQCRMIFSGVALPTFDECVVGHDVEFVFDGAALLTVQFLSMLAHRSGHGGLQSVQHFIHDLYGRAFEPDRPE